MDLPTDSAAVTVTGVGGVVALIINHWVAWALRGSKNKSLHRDMLVEMRKIREAAEAARDEAEEARRQALSTNRKAMHLTERLEAKGLLTPDPTHTVYSEENPVTVIARSPFYKDRKK